MLNGGLQRAPIHSMSDPRVDLYTKKFISSAHSFELLQRMRGSLPIVLVLTVSLSLNVLGIAWGLPNYVDWAQDSIALETMEAIAKRFSNGWFAKYPPVHYAVLAVFLCALHYLSSYFWRTGHPHQGFSRRSRRPAFYPYALHSDR
jgi:hypothetical protein